MGLLCCWMLCYGVCAQNNGNDKNRNWDSENLMKQEEGFYDALRFRSALNLSDNKRILHTTIKSIEAFQDKYQGTDLTLDDVIRSRLHTAIWLDQKRNLLRSMDGSVFDLPEYCSAAALTDRLISLIEGMYYGADEVKQLKKKLSRESTED
jgi:hypothetical protein